MNYAKIVKIIFDRYTDETIEKISEVQIDRLSSNLTIDKTIYDPKLGIINNTSTKSCEICGKTWNNCIGGYGFIKLPYPFLNPILNKIVIKKLKNICPIHASKNCKCKKLDLIERKSLPECKIHEKEICCCNENTKKINSNDIEIEFFCNNTKKVYSIKNLKIILEKIGSKDLIYNNLIVTPSSTRPNYPKSNQEYQNDTSTLYNSILKTKDSTKIKELYGKIEMLLTQKKQKSLPNSSKIPKSFQCIIQKKDGIITSGINGRRVNHSARSVITGFPFGKLGEIGISTLMAEKITKKIPLVRLKNYYPYNFIDYILKFENYKLYNCKKNLSYRAYNEEKLRNIIKNIENINDWYIDVPIEDGDIVIGNRQPSLRMESIISHTVKIVDNSNTTKIHLSCTTPYNADFDGDECNIHTLQDDESSMEIYMLASPKELILSSQKGTPLIGLVQDTILAIYLLSKKEYISKDDIFDYATIIEEDYFKKEKDYFNVNKCSNLNGGFVISLCFHKSFFYQYNNFKIINGIIVKNDTYLNKDILCSGFKSIVHTYYFDRGHTETVKLYDKLIAIGHNFLFREGFSLGIEDIKPKNKFKIEGQNFDINSILNTANFNKDEKNCLDFIVESGAKGSNINIMQIKYFLGLQTIDGQNMENELRSKRKMIYFKDDSTKQSNGFVFSSFHEGLSKTEMAFHCKAGRRGVSDSVTKVADSGYNTKKLTKFMEDMYIHYDFTVRGPSNNIVQYAYGYNLLDPRRTPAENGVKTYFTKKDFNKYGIYDFKTAKKYILALEIQPLESEIITNIKYDILNKIKPYFVEKPTVNIDITLDDDLVKRMTMDFFIRTMQPGTPIGCIAATNFGEITSQLLLQSFHYSGIKSMNITGGIQRINQLLNRTCKTIKENILCFARLKDEIYESQRLFYLNIDDDKIEYKKVIKLFMEDRCQELINKIKIIKYEKIVKYIITKCKNKCHFYNCYCKKIDKIRNIYLFPDYFDMSILKKNNELQKLEFEINDKELIIYFNTIENAVSFNIIFLNSTLNDNNFIIDYEFDYEINDFLLIFKGINLNTLLKIDIIDKTSIYSNDIFENEDFFGIETARIILYNEIERVCKFDGANISKCFISFICDAMTYNGKMISITNLDNRIITNALFEKPIKKIISYSLTKTEDNCESMESALLLGNYIKMGTCFSEIF